MIYSVGNLKKLFCFEWNKPYKIKIQLGHTDFTLYHKDSKFVPCINKMNFAVFFFLVHISVSFCKNSNAIVLAFCVHNFQIHLTTINDLFKFTKPVVVSECVVDFESANTVIPCQGLCVCVREQHLYRYKITQTQFLLILQELFVYTKA